MPLTVFKNYWLPLFAAAFLSVSCQSRTDIEPTKARTYENLDPPNRFDENIDQLTSDDASDSIDVGSVLFVGSSSIRMWHERIEEDLFPISVIARGFGGSNFADLLHYSERIVYPYNPSAIVVYEGDNDIYEGIPPEAVLDKFIEFETQVRKELPSTEIYFIAIKPSVSRVEVLPQVIEANRIIESHCNSVEHLYFIDTATPTLDANGQPLADLFIEDLLHLNEEGYELWTSIIRPFLLETL